MAKKLIPISNKSDDLYIVGIGASAGGLSAFERFFKNMPEDSGMGFVLVPHLDPKHISMMPEIIQKSTRMKVVTISDGIPVEANTVYIVPPNHDLGILNGSLQLLNPAKISAPRMPIDSFFKTLALDQGDKAICVILSGMGSDGSHGLKSIKGELGIALAQSPETAGYDSMPQRAIETGLVDFILAPEKMPKQLIAYTNHIINNSIKKDKDVKILTTNDLHKIFILIRTRTGHDFSQYKLNTINRRIERRMSIHQFEKLHHYVRYLQENVSEVDTLFKELLIGVTNFFRDKEAYSVLKKDALKDLILSKPSNYTFRVWVPACSSGEEAYSIAMLLEECTIELNHPMSIQVFATDIDPTAIDYARAGKYPFSISSDVNPDQLGQFFQLANNQYVIKKNLREKLVFAPQNVIKDPPFTKLDLISCRNLLIYLNPELQKNLLPIFHYSLNPGGILFLGSSETIGSFTDLFIPVDKKWKIFKRKEGVFLRQPILKFTPMQTMDKPPEKEVKKPSEMEMAQLAEKFLLSNYAPPGVVVNEKGEIIYIHGRTGKYLEPAPGNARMNIFDMAREGLGMELNSAIRKAFTEKIEVNREGVEVKSDGNTQLIKLSVKPISQTIDANTIMMITFEDIKLAEEKAAYKSKANKSNKKTDTRIQTLEKELQYTKEMLQSTIEELETSNEELNSSNEELQSTNEELQSTNEELETSKEEQQSMNEELTTVNAELNDKLDELSRSNDDLNNLLDAIKIPTLFLDKNLCIKRFTSHITNLINIINTDIGRPAGDIVSKIKNIEITDVAIDVLKDLVYREKEVQTTDRKYYTMRIAPYRTTENVIDGVVITFTDLTKTKELEEKEKRLTTERRLASFIEDSNDAITIQDFEGKIINWNSGAEKMYGYSKSEAIKMNIKKIIPEEKHQEFQEMINQIKQEKNNKPFKTKRKDKNGKILEVWLTSTSIKDNAGKPIQIATTERNLAWLAE